MLRHHLNNFCRTRVLNVAYQDSRSVVFRFWSRGLWAFTIYGLGSLTEGGHLKYGGLVDPVVSNEKFESAKGQSILTHGTRISLSTGV